MDEKTYGIVMGWAAALDKRAEAERNRIVALLDNMPEPFVNAMMEARVREAAGLHMADQISAMCSALAAMINNKEPSNG